MQSVYEDHGMHQAEPGFVAASAKSGEHLKLVISDQALLDKPALYWIDINQSHGAPPLARTIRSGCRLDQLVRPERATTRENDGMQDF
ncbi:hypothetical protein AGR13a_Lc30066 [Agrobacterium genomosp. 13 str. CFBP 6927]|uniref:Uncharacterized protein n=1 Tax=Agrobacterium genomosp. 13 str. CFBP 6927 TaxID=1183428 RepID=A0ABM9VLJ6_9HYPH|nr:hypothetical protein AGR13a_Lc30066 [Agrobacterium genomosp. 13 str. CFBP 6927]